MKDGWQVQALEEAAEVEYGTRVVRKRDGGSVYPVYGGGGETFHMDTYNRSDRVVVARFGMSPQCTRFVAGEFFLNDSGLTLRSRDPSRLTQEFLDAWTLSANDLVSSLGKGSAQKNLDVPAFRRIPIAVPPLEEQERIVRILDEALDGIATARANTEANLAASEELLAADLDAAITQSAQEWPSERLVSLCKQVTVGHVGPMKQEYQPAGIPFLRSQNVRPFELALDNVYFVSAEFHRKLSKSALSPGDVAIVRTGYPGTAAVVPDSMPVANCADLVIARPGPRLLPQFLAAFLNSHTGKRMVGAELVGAAQKHFNVTSAKQALVPVPPLDRQQVLVDQVTSMRQESARLRVQLSAKAAQLTLLRTGLLQRAFVGDL